MPFLTLCKNMNSRKNNVLDIFITNKQSLITYCSLIPGISDHEAACIKSVIQATIQYTNHNMYVTGFGKSPQLIKHKDNYLKIVIE